MTIQFTTYCKTEGKAGLCVITKHFKNHDDKGRSYKHNDKLPDAQGVLQQAGMHKSFNTLSGLEIRLVTSWYDACLIIYFLHALHTDFGGEHL